MIRPFFIRLLCTKIYYKTYLKKLRIIFQKLSHSFDLGPEFEIALCKILQDLLPTKFGVCRGFIIDSEGTKAGDDIIIYDRLRFPTIRMLGNENFAQKEKIPFEAVYCYIEAKHNLELDKDEGSLIAALNQIQKIKLLKRPDRSLLQITESCTLGSPFQSNPPDASWTNKYNPLYTCIISRKTSLKKITVLI